MYSVSTNRALLWQAERTTYTPTGWRSSPRIASTSALRYTVAYWCTVSYRNPDILAGTHRCHYRRLLAHDLAGEVQVRHDQVNRLIFDLCTLRSIVMLCNIVECGKKKCEQYWPESAGQEVPYPGLIHSTPTVYLQITYGALQVKATGKSEFEKLMTVTTLTMSDGSVSLP